MVKLFVESVKKTNRLVSVEEGWPFAGIGAELAAVMMEQAFDWLDAPVTRLGGLDTPVPFSPPLEDAYRPNAQKIYDAAQALARY